MTKIIVFDYYKYRMGDTRKDAVTSIWNNEKYRNVRRFLTGKLSNDKRDFLYKYCIRY